MADWPYSLKINRINYAEAPPNRTVRSAMDVGPQKLRRRSSSQVRAVSFNLFLTDALLVTFDAFYLANDASVFNFTDPRTNTTKRARFVELPTYNLNDTMWAVAIKLEYLP